ncbi:MAG TPA: PP2C family protein-serine/threonine phosphatase, partial [Terriglobales bacterium]
AALLMSATRGMLRSLAEAACTPGEVLTKLNRLMVADFPSGRFVTMIYGVLDPAKRMLTFANAGHLPPLLVSPPAAKAASGAGLSGTTEAVPSQSQDGGQALSSFVPTESGLPLGLSAAVVFSESTVELPPGARLAFYSDGITEAENGDQDEYGSMRLEQHFAGPQASVESILEDVRSFAAPLPLRDDATVIVVKASA